jgi:hypothetical protein
MTKRIAWFVFTIMCAAARAGAQPAAFEIMDNSFLIEEAFNQPAGIFQNIFSWSTSDGDWDATFTQEWPVRGQRHQLSYTIPFAGLESASGIGDVLLNYRYQLATESARGPAVSPRLSVVLPTSREVVGTGAAGLQVNMPFSKQRGDLYVHWNAGFTWLPRVDAGENGDAHVALTSPHAGASGIWRVTPMFNLMLETLLVWEDAIRGPNFSTAREATLTLSPGFRRAWNVRDHQIVVGAAVPFSRTEGSTGTAFLTYFSYELPY